MSDRQQKISDTLLAVAGQYIAREANRDTLITPTNATISPDLKNATIYLSVFPDTKEKQALAFVERHQSDFRSFMKSRVHFKVLPRITFAIDYGEKNRQRIDDLLNSE